MNNETKKLVTALKKKRESEGYSIRGLATQIGVSFSSLARIERGEGEPDNNSRIRILEWLGEDAANAGLSFENVALAHFRAAKNIDSKTVDCLVKAANVLKTKYGVRKSLNSPESAAASSVHENLPVTLSKSEMEQMAQDLRTDLNLNDNAPLNALAVKIDGVSVFTPDQIELDSGCLAYLEGTGADSWSAMSVPLDEDNSSWAILRNTKHLIQRQRVTYLEECWHILLDHKLTKIAKIGNAYGRTYESNEEHDAFFLAAASLLPASAVKNFVKTKEQIDAFAEHFGVSLELVEYRIKRLGLWREYKGRAVQLADR